MNTLRFFSLLALLLTLLTGSAFAQQRDNEYAAPFEQAALAINTGTQAEQADFLQTLANTYELNEYELVCISRYQRQTLRLAEIATNETQRVAAFDRFDALVNTLLDQHERRLIALGR